MLEKSKVSSHACRGETNESLSDSPTADMKLDRMAQRRILMTGVGVLAASAATAWLVHSVVASPATAQVGDASTVPVWSSPAAGAKLAATSPETPTVQPLAIGGASGLVRGSLADASAVRTAPLLQFSRIVIEPGRSTVFEGRARPGVRIVLASTQRQLGYASTGADGTWMLTVSQGLGAGDHRIMARIDASNAVDGVVGDDVRISIPIGLTAQTVVLVGERDVREAIPVRVAQVSAPNSPQPAAPTPTNNAIAPVLDWVQRARDEYQGKIVRKFTQGDAVDDRAVPKPKGSVGSASIIAQTTGPVAPPKAPLTSPPPTSNVMPAEPSIFESIQNWMKQANEDYQGAIVKKLTEPLVDPLAAEAQRIADEARKAADAKVGGDTLAKANDELRAAQAKRDADLKRIEAERKAADVVTKPASVPTKAAEDLQAKKLAEDKKNTDETLKRQADLRIAEEKRSADAKLLTEEAAKRQADAAAAEAKKAAEKAADDKRQTEAAARRQAELRIAEDKRETDAKKSASDSAKKQADEARLAQEAVAATALRMAAVEAEKQAAATEASKRTAAVEAAKQSTAAEAARKAAAVEAAKQLAATEAARRSNEELASRQAAAAAASAKAENKRAADATLVAEARRVADIAASAKTARIAEAKQAAKASQLAEAAAKVTIPVLPAPPPSKPIAQGRTVAIVQPSRKLPPIDRNSRSTLGAGGASSIAASVRKMRPSNGGDGCRLAGKTIKPPGTYVVQRGDTLWDIADRHYDDGARYGVIERANAGRLNDPDTIRPCQHLHVPKLKR